MSLYKPKEHIYFVCEGKSEENYLQLLNQTLRDCDAFPILHSVAPGAGQTQNGDFRNLRPRFSTATKAHPKNKVYIWTDDDLYVRNDKNNGTLLANAKTWRRNFLFSTHQFEDFLMLHMPDDTLDKWLDFCRARNHVSQPLHSAEYMPEFLKYFPDYVKGSLPEQIRRDTTTALSRMLRHNEEGRANGELHSEFADLLKKLFADCGIQLPPA